MSATLVRAAWLGVTALIGFTVLLAGCIVQRDEPEISAGRPSTILGTIQHWSVQYDELEESAAVGSPSPLRLERAKAPRFARSDEYLEKVRSRLLNKHHISLAENYSDRGYILVAVHGYNSEYDWQAETAMRESDPAKLPDHPPYTRTERIHQHSKGANAQVIFLDAQGRVLSIISTTRARKPEKLADIIAKCIAGKIK